MSGVHDETQARFEAALLASNEAMIELTLFISGASDLSLRAIANARALCDTVLSGRSTLVIVDVNEHPRESLAALGVLAAPTLVRNMPLPVRRLVGDLSRTERVLQALDLDLPRQLGGGDAPRLLAG